MVAKQNALKQENQKNKLNKTKEKPLQVVHQMTNLNLSEFDRLIHERLRLGIVSALAVNRSLTFNELKKLLNSTDGNLSVHARKLEDADYIECKKSFEGRTPKTEYSLTARGREALQKYLDHMEALIRSVREEE